MTKRKILSLATAIGFAALLPIVLIIVGSNRWFLLAAVCTCMAIVFALCLRYGNIIVESYLIIVRKVKNRLHDDQLDDITYPLISKEQQEQLDNAVQVTFTGDLILLREMIERAYNNTTGNYEFDAMFEYVNEIWKGSNLSIGVFEGPMSGSEYGFSTSNFDDNIPLRLNYPDSFASAIKKAGINLVTLANNHIFDMGVDGGLRTVRVLDEIGLDHVGLNTKESYSEPKIVNVCGKRVGILAYTYGQNGKPDSFFFERPICDYIKPVLTTGSRYFKRNVALVKEDFKRMKAENPDLIVVLPHMGEQFRSKPDKTQRKWCKIFCNLGADIIFSDHAHHVQPIEWHVNKKGKRSLIVHCPGNFINSFVGYDGDASMIVKAYLNRQSLEPFAVSVIPIYAHCPQNGMWIGLPTYKAVANKEIYNSLSRADFRRINKVNNLVTGTALGTPLDVHTAQKEYISFFNCGLVRPLPPPIQITDNQCIKSCLLKAVSAAESICFLGDSVTDGTKNGGIGWYEPLLAMYPEKQFTRFSEGCKTSKWLYENATEIAGYNADLYVVAIGCNDIRYRNSKICAMTAEAYKENLLGLVKTVTQHNSKAKFAFVAPWRSLSFDTNFNVLSHADRMSLYKEYTDVLQSFCNDNGHLFLDPNPLIFDNMITPYARVVKGNEILKDFIHPNAGIGVDAYCKAVVLCKQNSDNAVY